MSGPPRRRPGPAITAPSFDDERPTPVATNVAEIPPEPPTVPAISITAPTFGSSAKVPLPGKITPTFAEAAATGPFAKTHVRDGEGRTMLDLPAQAPPSGKITAPNFAEAAKSGPFARARTPAGDAQTVSERIELPPGEATPPPAPAPRPAARAPIENKPTEVAADPWEYRGEAPEQAASLAADYESGGVELDHSGRLVAPGHRGRGKSRRDSSSEVSEVSAPADLLSVGLDAWPEEPPPSPSAPPPRVDPVMEAPPPPPPEPDTAPRPPPPRRATPRAPGAQRPSGPPRPSVAHQETVLRAPRSPEPELEPEEEFFDESAPLDDPEATDDPDAPDDPEPGDPLSDEARYEDDGEGLDGPTNVRDSLDDSTDLRRYSDDSTGVRGGYTDESTDMRSPPRRRERSRWPGRLFLLLFLGAGSAAIWLWYTDQWGAALAWLRALRPG